MSACSSGGVLRQHDFRLPERAANVHVGRDRLDDPLRLDVERRIELVEPVEPHRAVAQDVEPASLKVVGAPHGVDGAGEPELVVRRLVRRHRSPPSVRFTAPRLIGAPGGLQIVGRERPDRSAPSREHPSAACRRCSACDAARCWPVPAQRSRNRSAWSSTPSRRARARIGSTLMTPVVTPRSPSTRGAAARPLMLQIGVHPDVAHLVVDHLEVVPP